MFDNKIKGMSRERNNVPEQQLCLCRKIGIICNVNSMREIFEIFCCAPLMLFRSKHEKTFCRCLWFKIFELNLSLGERRHKHYVTHNRNLFLKFMGQYLKLIRTILFSKKKISPHSFVTIVFLLAVCKKLSRSFSLSVGNHFIWQSVNSTGSLNVPPSVGFLHHYRGLRNRFAE